MSKSKASHAKCMLCKKHFLKENMVPVKMLRRSFFETLEEVAPHLSSRGFICFTDVKKKWTFHLKNKKKRNRGLSSPEEAITTNINEEFADKITFGERIADKVSEFGGSWSFLGYFTLFILMWVGLNTVQFFWGEFDPYPYIFLNLILSCLAAIQAPIIMMSQNRHAAKDRLQIEYDYEVNLKAALEIQEINQKLDHFLKIYQEQEEGKSPF